VVEGRWVTGRKGYELRVGIDLSIPSAIYIRSAFFHSHVPFLRRPSVEVEERLNVELTAYGNAFLDRYQPVPQASALAAEELRQLGLSNTMRPLPGWPLGTDAGR
jgi:hypothetical protein